VPLAGRTLSPSRWGPKKGIMFTLFHQYREKPGITCIRIESNDLTMSDSVPYCHMIYGGTLIEVKTILQEILKQIPEDFEERPVGVHTALGTKY